MPVNSVLAVCGPVEADVGGARNGKESSGRVTGARRGCPAPPQRPGAVQAAVQVPRSPAGSGRAPLGFGTVGGTLRWDPRTLPM